MISTDLKTYGKVVASFGESDVAHVHVLKLPGTPEKLVEFVDSLDPRFPANEKWCGNLSTQAGCPVGCLMCDAGGGFKGNLSKDEILAQCDRIMDIHLQDGTLDSQKIKLHFARMGEPALNPEVLDVIKALPSRYPAINLIPSVATTAPKNSTGWLSLLLKIKNEYFKPGRFQLQFSVNSTDEKTRDWLMPIKKLNLSEIGEYSRLWHNPGDRKVSLNLALGQGIPVDPQTIANSFSPDSALIKLTPINPTETSIANGLETVISPEKPQAALELSEKLEDLGFEVILSIGDPREIEIGSNCGQAAKYVAQNYNKLQNESSCA